MFTEAQLNPSEAERLDSGSGLGFYEKSIKPASRWKLRDTETHPGHALTDPSAKVDFLSLVGRILAAKHRGRKCQRSQRGQSCFLGSRHRG